MTTLTQNHVGLLPSFSGQFSGTSSALASNLYAWLLPTLTTNNPSQGIYPIALYFERSQINNLSKLDENWDSYGSVRPNQTAILKASELIEQLYQLATSAGLSWIKTHISASESGEVVFEWWNNDHKLTVYIGSGSVEYIQVWGLDIVNEMSDGTLTQNKFQNLWKWLH